MFSITISDLGKTEQKVEDGLYGTCQRCCDAIETARRLVIKEENKSVEVKSGDALVYSVSLNSGKIVEVDNRSEIIGCA